MMLREHNEPAGDLELDLFGFMPVQTQCDWCQKVVPLAKATVSTYHITDHVTEVEHYCGQEHALLAWRQRSGDA
jgi:hypothetical protein